jgi:hypothetical protein
VIIEPTVDATGFYYRRSDTSCLDYDRRAALTDYDSTSTGVSSLTA